MKEVAIIGGGPAGSYCAYWLAKNDVPVVIFDHSHPREKPCGGLVSPLAQRLLPFLEEIPVERNERKAICFVSPYGRRVRVLARRKKLLCFSRQQLDRYLLDIALKEGAEWINEKVIALKPKGDAWRIKTTKQSYTAKMLVGADGANSIVRKNTIGPLSSTDKGICYGYLVKGLEKEEITFNFLFHRTGYIWIIPRKRNTSIGIGCANIAHSHGIKRELDLFIQQRYPYAEKILEWAALIPNVKDVKTFLAPIAGTNWILIGDAAGHVDPVFGEGIVYALLDGKLAAQTIVENNPHMFWNLWNTTYGWMLLRRVRLMKWISKKPFLELFIFYLKLGSLT